MAHKRTTMLHDRAEPLLVKERFQVRRTSPHVGDESKIIIMAYARESGGNLHIGDDVDKAPELEWSTFTYTRNARKLRERIDHASYADAMKHFEACIPGGRWRL